LPFSIRKEQSTKCHSCVQSHIVKIKGDTSEVVVCRLLGTPMRPVDECSQFMPLIHAGVPAHMVAQAWMMKETDPTEKKVGFGGSKNSGVTFISPDADEEEE
jgi:hypothetical protein